MGKLFDAVIKAATAVYVAAIAAVATVFATNYIKATKNDSKNESEKED